MDMVRLHLHRRRLGGLATAALAIALAAPFSVVTAATSVPLHQAHVGTVADCGANGILWHFVLNQLDAGTASGTVTATFASAGAKSDAGEPVGNGKVQHFWIATGSADTLLGASASVADQSGSPKLVLSHWECGDAAPNTPPSNPASNPPSGDVGGSSGAVRENTKGSNSGPIVAVLPNTAMDASTGSLLLVLGVMLVGATATLVMANVRSDDRRRR
jgi:hypothetical protein